MSGIEELLDNWYALGRKYGIQMMLILGYTPTWLGEKPVNYLDDWVNACAFTWHPREVERFWLYLDRVTQFAAGKAIPVAPGPGETRRDAPG